MENPPDTDTTKQTDATWIELAAAAANVVAFLRRNAEKSAAGAALGATTPTDLTAEPKTAETK